MPAPRQEDCFGGSLQFVRVWVGPHSAQGLKLCSSAEEGMPSRVQFVLRLNYTGTRDWCQRAEVFRSAREVFSRRSS